MVGSSLPLNLSQRPALVCSGDCVHKCIQGEVIMQIQTQQSDKDWIQNLPFFGQNPTQVEKQRRSACVQEQGLTTAISQLGCSIWRMCGIEPGNVNCVCAPVCVRAPVCRLKLNDCLHLRRLRLESTLFSWLIWPSLPRAVWPRVLRASLIWFGLSWSVSRFYQSHLLTRSLQEHVGLWDVAGRKQNILTRL